jgi:two-component system sensor histidine kinase YesM
VNKTIQWLANKFLENGEKMKKLKQLFKQQSIFVKLVLMFFLVGIFPLILLSSLSFKQFSSNFERITVSNGNQMTLYAEKNVDQLIEKYNNITKLMYSFGTESIRGKLGDQLYILQDPAANQVEKNSSRIVIQNFLRSVAYTDKSIENVFLLHYGNQTVHWLSTSNKQINTSYPFFEDPWITEALKNETQLSVFPAHQEDHFRTSNESVFSISRNYVNPNRPVGVNEILATLKLDISTNTFDNIFQDIYLGENGVIYIIDEQGKLIYGDEKLAADTIINNRNWLDTLEKGGKGSEIFYHDNKILMVHKVDAINWYIVGQMDRKDIQAGFLELRNNIIYIILFCLVLLTIAALAFSKSFSSPIKQLLQSMKKVEKGDFNQKLKVRSKDEIGQLRQGYNQMVTELEKFIQRAYVSELKQKQFELTTLKDQIKPHYLYNTLEVIRMSAITNDDEQVADMINSLSKQLQYVIGHGDEIVTLHQEIQNVQNYFNLMKHRYNKRFDLEIDIPESLLESGILKLTLQPIVENAVQHGLKPKMHNGKVKISAEKAGENMLISIYDDGIGMNNVKLRKLQKYLIGQMIGQQTAEGWKGVGLKNVHDRIKSIFGEDSGMKVQSHENIGTSVHVYFPFIEEVHQYDEASFRH